ncbi:MAG: hypothetical protein IH950_04680 [Bacteroidetes bacterium]|nr:hypothetical protein [Bacteroidota bacterium]MCH8033042.1 hypothetical protein [Bacteroidota bacterium]
MLKTKSEPVEIGTKLYDPDEVIKNGLEEELDSYTRAAVSKIRFKLIIKPALISIIALIVSFFLDVSAVPFLGNVTFDLARSLFPGWEPPTVAFEPYSFWWLPVVSYGLFLFIAFISYSKLKIEIIRTPATETIDRLIQAATSVIDSIATALPLIGAAILLVSIRLGEEVFLGIAIPFEIKALIVLAIGKLFEPVLDQLGVEFQNVVNHVKDIREKYFSRIQIENSKAILKQINPQAIGSAKTQMSVEEMAQYKNLVEHTAKLSGVMLKNFASIQEILDKLSNSQPISSEKLREMSSLAESITQASNSLTDERTLAGLKHLEAIVVKK